jgi:hypothetical protein
MPSIPGNGVEPPAASSSSLKTESSPSGPLDLRGDAKSPRRCSRKPLLTLDMRWQRMRRGTAARSKDIEVASQGQSERAAAATASACVTGSAQLENSPILAPRVLAPRARLLFAAVARHGDRWLVSLNVEAPEFHAERRHRASPVSRGRGFVGIDRGIAAFVVAATADGLEVARFHAPGRWLAGSAEYSDVLKPSRAPSAVPAIASKPSGSWHGNTRALPTSARTSYIGFRASWPRPTAS